jgi:flagellar secretion chaperone FliS
MYSSDSLVSFSAGAQRSRFTDGSLETASGGQVIVMCFDRLDRDLDGALIAIDATDHETTNSLLRHAQDLLSEMVGMLDVEAWEHAPALLSVYDYLLRRLAQANMFKDAAAVSEARHLIGEIGDAFRTAAAESLRTQPPAQSPAQSPAQMGGGFGTELAGDRPRLSVRA